MLGSVGTLRTTASALTVGFGSAGELDRHLALKDGLSVELGDGTISLGRGGQSHKGISDRALGAGVGGDRGGFTRGNGTLARGRNDGMSVEVNGQHTQGNP